MSQDYPGDDALEMLEEFRADPRGYSHIDLKKLLDAWGVTEELTEACAPGYRVCVHPDAPNFYFNYDKADVLSPGTVRWVCGALLELRRRLT